MCFLLVLFRLWYLSLPLEGKVGFAVQNSDEVVGTRSTSTTLAKGFGKMVLFRLRYPYLVLCLFACYCPSVCGSRFCQLAFACTKSTTAQLCTFALSSAGGAHVRFRGTTFACSLHPPPAAVATQFQLRHAQLIEHITQTESQIKVPDGPRTKKDDCIQGRGQLQPLCHRYARQSWEVFA